MNQFLKKIFFISLPVLGFVLLTFWQTDGKADPFYLRFVTPKQHSMILGTSRGAQGVVPHVIDSVTGKVGMFNYAMTVVHSPYGEAYFESVKEKLDPGTKDRLFILEVSPWSIGSRKENYFGEANTFVGKLHCVDCKPNIEYLMRFYPYQYLHIWRTAEISTVLHADGWLEVSIDMDSDVVAERTLHKMEHYRTNMLPTYQFSETRYEYLKKTIELLQKHGRVFLVRIPVYPEMYDMENVLMPDFDEKMETICASAGVAYLNYGADGKEYIFTDGNHLWKGSAEKFSVLLGEGVW